MKYTVLVAFLAYASVTTAAITWTLDKATNPSPDQLSAYPKIEAAMKLAVARHARLGSANKTIHVFYAPGVPTAEANRNGDLRFGSNRSYMTERTALHEISHTLGVGQSAAFDSMCGSGKWKTALPLLKSWDGDGARVNCGGGHFWPYGLNYENEWSDRNADRNVLIVNAMLRDGM